MINFNIYVVMIFNLQIKKKSNIKIRDPYRWLEDSKSTETATFVREQNAITSKYIHSNVNYESIKEKYVFVCV